jgi:hypothetical protein
MLVPGLQALNVRHVVHVLTMCLMGAKFEQASLTSKMTAQVMVDAFHKFRVVCALEGFENTSQAVDGGRRPQLEGQQLLAGQHSGLAFSDVPISVQILRICQTGAFPVLSKFPWTQHAFCAKRAVRTSSPQRGEGSVIRPPNGEEGMICTP